MKITDLEFKTCGCCGTDRKATLTDGDTTIVVTDCKNGTYSVYQIRSGLMVEGSAKIMAADDEI